MPGKKTFVDGNTLTAADVNGYLMDQSVMRFASASARDTAIPSPTEGMVCYLDDLNYLMVYTGSAWTITGGDKPYFAGSVSGYSLANNATVGAPIATTVTRGFANSSGVITVPSTGIYQISYYTSYGINATGRRQSYIQTSAGVFAVQNMHTLTTADSGNISGSTTILLTAGNTFSINIFQSSGAALSTNVFVNAYYLGS